MSGLGVRCAVLSPLLRCVCQLWLFQPPLSMCLGDSLLKNVKCSDSNASYMHAKQIGLQQCSTWLGQHHTARSSTVTNTS